MRRLATLASVLGLLVGLVFAGAALGRSPRGITAFVITDREPSGFEKRVRARVVAHGPFVPGQPASISIRRMPKRAFMFVWIQPIQSTPACASLLCVPTTVVPDESNPTVSGLARASGRGRALVTFTMPTSFQAYIPSPSGKLTKQPQPVAWQQGQALQMVVAGAKENRRGDEIVGVAGTKTVVQVQPTPTS
jgi:hypothetical protein